MPLRNTSMAEEQHSRRSCPLSLFTSWGSVDRGHGVGKPQLAERSGDLDHPPKGNTGKRALSLVTCRERYLTAAYAQESSTSLQLEHATLFLALHKNLPAAKNAQASAHRITRHTPAGCVSAWTKTSSRHISATLSRLYWLHLSHRKQSATFLPDNFSMLNKAKLKKINPAYFGVLSTFSQVQRERGYDTG